MLFQEELYNGLRQLSCVCGAAVRFGAATGAATGAAAFVGEGVDNVNSYFRAPN